MTSRVLKTAIIGAGGQAGIITEIFKITNQNLVGYISSEPKGTVINGYSVICSVEEFIDSKNEPGIQAVFVSIGDNYLRGEIVKLLQPLNLSFINCIHPNAVIASSAKMGCGILINAGAVIQNNVTIGDHCNIGTSSSIDHDCYLDSLVNVAPGATVCGTVRIGLRTVVGPGVTVLEKTKIGSDTIIGAGAVVLEDVPDQVVYVGVPAKKLKERVIGQKYLR
jgi:UDP-perosamine 4-acetyltransferase